MGSALSPNQQASARKAAESNFDTTATVARNPKAMGTFGRTVDFEVVYELMDCHLSPMMNGQVPMEGSTSELDTNRRSHMFFPIDFTDDEGTHLYVIRLGDQVTIADGNVWIVDGIADGLTGDTSRQRCRVIQPQKSAA